VKWERFTEYAFLKGVERGGGVVTSEWRGRALSEFISLSQKRYEEFEDNVTKASTVTDGLNFKRELLYTI
jgi:hypothetical protein